MSTDDLLKTGKSLCLLIADYCIDHIYWWQLCNHRVRSSSVQCAAKWVSMRQS